MATLALIFPAGTVPTALALTSLTGSPAASTALPVAFAGPSTLPDGRNRWAATFAGDAAQYAYVTTATINGTPRPFTGTVAGDGTGASPTFASGRLFDQNDLSSYLKHGNLAVLSSGEYDGTASVDAPTAQRCIDVVEAYITSGLAAITSPDGARVFALPLAIDGAMPRLAQGSVGGPLLRRLALPAAASWLTTWMQAQSLQGDQSAPTRTAAQANKWWAEVDQALALIERWAGTGTGGLLIDLDRADGTSGPAAVAAGAVPRPAATPLGTVANIPITVC